MTDIPDFLAERGITRVEDNLNQGQCVLPSASLFWTLFGGDVMATVQDKTQPWRSKNDDKAL